MVRPAQHVVMHDKHGKFPAMTAALDRHPARTGASHNYIFEGSKGLRTALIMVSATGAFPARHVQRVHAQRSMRLD